VHLNPISGLQPSEREIAICQLDLAAVEQFRVARVFPVEKGIFPMFATMMQLALVVKVGYGKWTHPDVMSYPTPSLKTRIARALHTMPNVSS
jgi:hypothetical protein